MDSHMEKTTLNFADASAEVVTMENLLYARVSGIFTDEVAMELIRFMKQIIAQIPAIPIRVWDANGVPAEGFKLSTQCNGSAKSGPKSRTRCST
jgi:hypothetical protein